MAIVKSTISALNVTVVYHVAGETKTFSDSVVAQIVIDRYLQLECGDTVGLFVPAGKDQQVNALNIEWFEIERIMAPKE